MIYHSYDISNDVAMVINHLRLGFQLVHDHT